MVALLVACGGGAAEGPPPPSIDVTGQWSFSMQGLSSSVGPRCTMEAVQLTLQQTGATVTGTFDGGSMDCKYNNFDDLFQVGIGPIVAGSVSGSSLSFDLADSTRQQSGSLADAQHLSGDARWTIAFGDQLGTVVMTGRWTATRQ